MDLTNTVKGPEIYVGICSDRGSCPDEQPDDAVDLEVLVIQTKVKIHDPSQ
jgi:hypothetical protein